MSEYGAGYLAYKLLRLVVERNGVCTEYSLEQGVREAVETHSESISGALKHLAYKLLGVVVEEYSLEQGMRVLHTVGKVQLRLRAEWSNTSHNPPPQSYNCSCHYLKFSGQNPAQLIEGECV